MASRFKRYLRRRREKLFLAQKGLCFYCAQPMLLATVHTGQKQPPRLVTLDHIVPKSAGGTIGNDNTVAACAKCNQERGTEDARLFMLRKQGMVA